MHTANDSPAGKEDRATFEVVFIDLIGNARDQCDICLGFFTTDNALAIELISEGYEDHGLTLCPNCLQKGPDYIAGELRWTVERLWHWAMFDLQKAWFVNDCLSVDAPVTGKTWEDYKQMTAPPVCQLKDKEGHVLATFQAVDLDSEEDTEETEEGGSQ